MKLVKSYGRGGPLSPIIFNFVVGILSRMLRKATSHDLVRGLGSTFVLQGVVCLQYAYDTIIFIVEDLERATNLKWVLSCFEMMSRMRISYFKSELVPVNLEELEVKNISDTLGCPVETFPPLHYQKLKREDFQPLVDKTMKNIASWRGKLLSHADRIDLIKTCLASVPVYLMSFFKFPKWALYLINSHMVVRLWNDYEGHGKIHLANWHLVSMKKEFGGLAIPNVKDLNMTLLGS